MRCSIFISITAIFFFCSSVMAGESFSDLEGSVESKEFTSAEKRYFIDATDRYKKYTIRDEFKARSIIAWLDNDRIVFSARRLPGWETKSDEPSRIIALNVTTRDYIDSGYRGRLFCLNHLGDMMIRQGGNEEINYSSIEKYEWLIGKWGDDLSHTQRPVDSVIPNYLCRFSSKRNRNLPTGNEVSISNLNRRIELLPEHGYLQEEIERTSNGEMHTVKMVKSDGSSNIFSEKAPQPLFFYFQPWAGNYIEKVALRHEPRIFHPISGFSSIPIPRLLEYWSLNSPSMAANAIGTRAGILWDVHQGNGHWKKQGFYLETSGRLLKVENGRGVYAVVSPDGCRIVDSVVRGDPYRTGSKPYTWLVIDICNLKQ